MVEDLRSEFKLVIEHVDGAFETLDRKMTAGFQEVHTRIDDLTRWTAQGFKEINARFDQNDKRWAENEVWQRENMQLLSKIDDRLERVEVKLDNHEERISTLEQHIFLPPRV